VYFAEDDTVKTLEICDQLRSQAESAGRMAHVIEINLLRALAMKAQGDVQASLESLEKCLSGAEPQGYTRLFLEAGPPALKLLRVADSEGIHSEYVGRLLASFGVSQARIQKGTLPAIPSQDLIEPLSQREHEVFKLIIAGSTNQEIADELVVSLNTVKKHTTHIYGKLGVRNRTQAIAKARQLDLIQ
jgi:LuxR family maltose regulon positive regulatory protein